MIVKQVTMVQPKENTNVNFERALPVKEIQTNQYHIKLLP